MKKITMIIALIMSVCIINVFAATTSNDSILVETNQISEVITKVETNVKNAPSNTVYGLSKTTAESYIVVTPLGEFNIPRENGGVSILGIWIKLESSKNGIYIIDSSWGKFKVNTLNYTITKL